MGDQGRLHVISGPMFAGKSEELMRLVRRASFAGLAVRVVSHALDTRHGTDEVASHAGVRIPAHAAADVEGLRGVLRDGEAELVAIDEAQFFGPGLVAVVEDALRAGQSVIVAGLSVTLEGRPFHPIPELAAVAEVATKLTAVCTVCGKDAAFHERLVETRPADAGQVQAGLIGGAESYQARCRDHFRPN